VASTSIGYPRASAAGAARRTCDQTPAGSSYVGWWQRARSSGWAGAAAFATIMATVVELLYLLGEVNASGRAIFMGQSWAPHDVAQYIAAMNDGAGGAFLIRDRLTSEPHTPGFIYGFYVLLGKVTGLAGIDSMLGYRLAGAFGRVFVILSLFSATRLLTTARWRRWLMLALIALGGGLASLMGLAAQLGGINLRIPAHELQEPEFGTFLLLFASPHLMFGLGLLVLAVQAYVACWRRGTVRQMVGAGLLTFALGVVNSYSLATLCAVVTVHAAVMTLLCRRPVWRGLIAAAVVVAAAMPIFAYGVLTFVVGADPFWGVAYGRQNQTPTPPPVDAFTALGAILVLALAGVPIVLRRPTPGRVMVLVWIATAIGMMYLPTGVQRRFAFGLQPMLAMVAAFTLPAVWSFFRSRRGLTWVVARPVGMLFVVQALFGSTAFLGLAALVMGIQAGQYDAGSDRGDFVPAELRPAAQWLAEHTGPDAVILSQQMTGNYLVHVVPGHVFIGHWSATVEFPAKRQLTAWFFAGPLDDERRAFIADRGITHVIYGPYEHLLGGDAAEGPGLKRVYAAHNVEIYQVVSATASGPGPSR
jgi:hypothetical protein